MYELMDLIQAQLQYPDEIRLVNRTQVLFTAVFYHLNSAAYQLKHMGNLRSAILIDTSQIVSSWHPWTEQQEHETNSSRLTSSVCCGVENGVTGGRRFAVFFLKAAQIILSVHFLEQAGGSWTEPFLQNPASSHLPCSNNNIVSVWWT